MLRRAQAIIATSQSYLDASHALANWHAKTQVVPLGIADAEPSRATGSPGPWRDGPHLRLLAVGRLSRYKGFDVLIEALAGAADVDLLLVGGGECEGELRALAAQRGVGGRIAFAGELDDDALAAAYESADAFVLPSRDRGEAFGLVLLEAMRAGLPVIASAIDGSGVGEVVVEDETGLLVPPGDAAALAGAVARLRGDDALRRRLGSGGRARWKSTFTLERSVQATRAMYREALARRDTDPTR